MTEDKFSDYFAYTFKAIGPDDECQVLRIKLIQTSNRRKLPFTFETYPERILIFWNRFSRKCPLFHAHSEELKLFNYFPMRNFEKVQRHFRHNMCSKSKSRQKCTKKNDTELRIQFFYFAHIR